MSSRTSRWRAIVLTALTVGASLIGAPSSSAEDITREGYWVAAADGGVFAFGAAPFRGSLAGVSLGASIVGIAHTPSGQGYWLAAADGGVFAFGDAAFLGSAAGSALQRPVVGIAASPVGQGYWLAAADGGVFAFGDATFLGRCYECGGAHPVVGIAANPLDDGYWLVTGRGAVLAYGSAPEPDEHCFGGGCRAIAVAPGAGVGLVWTSGESVTRYGDAPACSERLPDRVPGLLAVAVNDANDGCWALTEDGGIVTFGGAPFLGSVAGVALDARPVAMAALHRPPSRPAAETPARQGYWIAGADGGVFAFGDAPFLGSATGASLNQPVVDMAPTPSGNGYWLLAADGGVFAFGDAPFLGSLADAELDVPVTAIAATTTGYGYWLTVADGRLFAYGDAPYLHGCGNCRFPEFPLKDIAAARDGSGYWLLSSGSKTYPHGSVRSFSGSECRYPPACTHRIAASPTGGLVFLEDGDLSGGGRRHQCGFLERLQSPRLVDVALKDTVEAAGAGTVDPTVDPTVDGSHDGCWILAADGDVITRRGARLLGSLAGVPLRGAPVAIVVLPDAPAAA